MIFNEEFKQMNDAATINPLFVGVDRLSVIECLVQPKIPDKPLAILEAEAQFFYRELHRLPFEKTPSFQQWIDYRALCGS